MPTYRDHDPSRRMTELAHHAVRLYADIVTRDLPQNPLAPAPSWMRAIPTHEQIMENYLERLRSVSSPSLRLALNLLSRRSLAMKVDIAIDVQAIPLRVHYRRFGGGTSRVTTRIARPPLSIYTRRVGAGYVASWNALLDESETIVPIMEVQRGAGDLQLKDVHLPIDIAYPRTLEVRLQPRRPNDARLFSKRTEFSVNLSARINNTTYYVTLRHLNVEKDPDGDYARARLDGDAYVQDDDRFDGAPSSPWMTYLLLEAQNATNNKVELTALLRSRIAQRDEIHGGIWTPALTSYELEPVEYRVGDLVKRIHPPPPNDPVPPPPSALGFAPAPSVAWDHHQGYAPPSSARHRHLHLPTSLAVPPSLLPALYQHSTFPSSNSQAFASRHGHFDPYGPHPQTSAYSPYSPLAPSPQPPRPHPPVPPLNMSSSASAHYQSAASHHLHLHVTNSSISLPPISPPFQSSQRSRVSIKDLLTPDHEGASVSFCLFARVEFEN
ncbi:uncharacterized protein JCM6883_004455 [Sporobolomyces salmoneus]|uniref:uncharacterized protein n=1 Tax=Sporobolomyces salmoneus TaxID=183962 RepID=UPI003170A13D